MTNQTATKIMVRYSSIDGCRMVRRFKTLAGARRFAHEYVGKGADVGRSYAISSDGVGKVTVEGITLNELFSDKSRTFDDLSDAEQDDEIAYAEKQERIADQGQIVDAIEIEGRMNALLDIWCDETPSSAEDWAMREYDRS